MLQLVKKQFKSIFSVVEKKNLFYLSTETPKQKKKEENRLFTYSYVNGGQERIVLNTSPKK